MGAAAGVPVPGVAVQTCPHKKGLRLGASVQVSGMAGHFKQRRFYWESRAEPEPQATGLNEFLPLDNMLVPLAHERN